jgi:transposase
MRRQIPLTRQEKERKVINLYQKGMNIRDISKRVHMSFGDIGNITRKFSGEDKLERPMKYSKHSQSLELFQRGYTLLEVAKKLDMNDSQTKEEYNQYMHLTGFYKFCEFYEQNKGDLDSFLLLWQDLKLNGVSAREAIQGIKFALQLDQIKRDMDNLTRERAQLKSDIDQSLRELVEFNQKKISIQKEIDV